MFDNYEILRLRSKNWLHIYSNRDIIGWLGQFGDGNLFGSRKVELPGVFNTRLEDINHTDILRVGKRMDYWVTKG